jgi:hypothetical protein
MALADGMGIADVYEQSSSLEGVEMKLLMGVGALILLFSVPARAQSYGSNVGGGGSLNSGRSLNGGAGLGGVTFHSAPSRPGTVFHMVVTSGSANEYIPSTYVAFAKAVELGQAMEIAKPKSLAEVALEYRNEKRVKAETVRPQEMVEQGSRQVQ